MASPPARHKSKRFSKYALTFLLLLLFTESVLATTFFSSSSISTTNNAMTLLLWTTCVVSPLFLLVGSLDTAPSYTSSGPYVHLPKPGHRTFILEREIFALRCYSPNDENIFLKDEVAVKPADDDALHIHTFRVEDDMPPEAPYRPDARFYTSLQVMSAHANHSGAYVCQTENAQTKDDEFLYEWTISVIGQHSLMAQNVTYRKSQSTPNATLTCLSLAGQFLPVEWAKDGLAIPLGTGTLNQKRYRYDLSQNGTLTIIDAYKLNAGQHTFECRINSHALQAATQTLHHSLRTLSTLVRLNVLPKASSKWGDSSSATGSEDYKTAVVHVADIMQSDAQAQQTTRLDDGGQQQQLRNAEDADERLADEAARTASAAQQNRNNQIIQKADARDSAQKLSGSIGCLSLMSLILLNVAAAFLSVRN